MAGMGYEAKVIADSLAENGYRLTTMQVTFPRPFLAEMNTHRAFSRNSASSRAIPTKKMLERVMDDPYIPLKWVRNEAGMSGKGVLYPEAAEMAKNAWLRARDHAVQEASMLADLEVHKQLVNRLLEPFLWHTAIISATEWANFFNQRVSLAAQPEMAHIATLMLEAYQTSKPLRVSDGAWHLPYISDIERATAAICDLRKVSVARCARVSYLQHDGTRDLEKDIILYEKLISAKPVGHWSPLEHVARPVPARFLGDCDTGNFKGWEQMRKLFADENATELAVGLLATL